MDPSFDNRPEIKAGSSRGGDALIVFIKNPVAGNVKTRLAGTIGIEEALNVYNFLLKNTLATVDNLTDLHKYYFFSDFIPVTSEWQNGDYHKKIQKGSNLGVRMARAFEEILALHQKAVIIGTDCPTLTVTLIEDAFQKLETADFVIGPAQDGGYYLFGMKEFKQEIFEDIAWSTETVYAATTAKINSLKKNFYKLPVLRDIDEWQDWCAFVQGAV